MYLVQAEPMSQFLTMVMFGFHIIHLTSLVVLNIIYFTRIQLNFGELMLFAGFVYFFVYRVKRIVNFHLNRSIGR